MNHPCRNDDIIPTKEMYMLNSGGRKLGKFEIVKLDGTLLSQAHRCVLPNHPKIQPLRVRFYNEQQAIRNEQMSFKIMEKLFVEKISWWLKQQVPLLETQKFDQESFISEKVRERNRAVLAGFHVVYDFPSSSQQPWMHELEDDESDEKVSEVEIIDQHGNILRTTKMMTKDVYKLNEGEKILVHVNNRDQLIKDAAGLCTRFMTILLKQPNLCPFEAKDWCEVKTRRSGRLMGNYGAVKYRTKYKLYGLVRSRLDEANNIGVDEAHELEYTEDQILHALDLVDAPSKVHDQQWESYKAQLRSSKSIVQANKEISRKILELGCPEEEIDNEKRASIDRDVWIDLMGPGGEALGYGAGVTKSDVTSFNNELRKLKGGNFMNLNYVYKLLVQTKSQNSVIESQNKTTASLNKKVRELENTVGGFRDEVKLFQTMFQRACGSSDMFFPTQNVSHEDYTVHDKHNLINVGKNQVAVRFGADDNSFRTTNGMFNDVSDGAAGSQGTFIGRNMPPFD
ncbi:ribose 5-phosphate isomerase A [Tanacetum coccineum]